MEPWKATRPESADDFQEERRQVRIADVGPGMAAQQVPVDRREQPQQAVATAGEEDRGEAGIGRQPVERVKTLGIAACEQAVAGEDVGGQHRLEAEPAQGLEPRLQPRRIDGPGEGGHAHPVARTDGRGKLSGGNQNAGELRKPSSVSRRRSAGSGHSSGTGVAAGLQQPTRKRPRARRTGLEGGTGGPRTAPLFGLAPHGVCRASTVTGGAVRSYRTVSPLPDPRRSPAVYSLLHFPSRRRASPLASMLPVGARTFLSARSEDPRSDRLELSGVEGL